VSYLPFENITYKTKLNSEEILRRMSKIIEPKQAFRVTWFFKNNNYKPYEGNINSNSFSISRIIGYRNSFVPTIKGVIEKDSNGTIINIKMRLHALVIAVLFVWFGGMIINCLIAIPSIYNNQDFKPMSLIHFGLLIFGYVLVTSGFKYESRKSKKHFTGLFEAEN